MPVSMGQLPLIWDMATPATVLTIQLIRLTDGGSH